MEQINTETDCDVSRLDFPLRAWKARIVIVAFAAICAAKCFGMAASQAWVTNYVTQAIATSRAELEATATVTVTNGATEIVTGAGTGRVRVVVEDSTDAAMVATNCTAAARSAGITNGIVFVWNGAGAYVNPNGVISCTATNMTYSGVASVAVDGVERFAGWFDAYGVLIQAGTSLAITNGMAEVTR